MLSKASIDDTYGVNRILQCREDRDSRGVRSKKPTSAQPCLCQNRLTDTSQMPKIDVARLNALRLEPKPSDNPPEATSTHSDDAIDPMEVDRVPMGRTLKKRKEKVAKYLKRGANEKEMESFQKRVFGIPLEKPFEEDYFTHRLWMFF
ncbi:hypothetical protein F2Q68_00039299 [Brassica cretica]|uniref:Uncharacterized protein n=1 Tax=Brassica cretica TaxID=69181 RepID=A0A8S9M9P4_BRACR|nr:hypothetical protein F2Q68_00039299 [Brassica cretica]